MLADYLTLFAAISVAFVSLYLAWRVWKYHRAHYWRSRCVPALLVICIVMLLLWWRGRSVGYGVIFPLGSKTYGEIDLAAGRVAFSVTRCYDVPFIQRRGVGTSDSQMYHDYHLPGSRLIRAKWAKWPGYGLPSNTIVSSRLGNHHIVTSRFLTGSLYCRLPHTLPGACGGGKPNRRVATPPIAPTFALSHRNCDG